MLEKAEKVEQNTQLASDDPQKEFRSAVQVLWDQHIRMALIYGKDLKFCRTCFSFFYIGEQPSEHPIEDCESVNQFFAQAGITSVGRLVNFLWKAYSSITHVSKLRPSQGAFLTQKHAIVPTAQGGLPNVVGLQAKVHSLEIALDQYAQRIQELEAAKKILEEENEEIMAELLSCKLLRSEDLGRVNRLAKQISEHCKTDKIYSKSSEESN
jgi:hypothetical protein